MLLWNLYVVEFKIKWTEVIIMQYWWCTQDLEIHFCSQLLNPRSDIGKQSSYTKAKKRKEKEEKDRKDKDKDRNIEMESVNIDDYVAPGVHERLTQLKEAKEVEIVSLKQLRSENLQKIKDEQMDCSVCVCRKGIEGYMMRCCLCYDWFHGSCVSLPKVVNGKSTGKANSPVELTNDVKYLCPLCCRSRRPRIDTIFSLLVSLQKLPVRLPEGEALQFLTERTRNWQEKAKRILNDSSVVKLLDKLASNTNVLPTVNASAITGLAVTKSMIENPFEPASEHQYASTQYMDTNIGMNKIINKNTAEFENDSTTTDVLPDHNYEPISNNTKVNNKTDLPDSSHKDMDEAFSLECEEEMTESPKSAL